MYAIYAYIDPLAPPLAVWTAVLWQSQRVRDWVCVQDIDDFCFKSCRFASAII